MCIYIHIHIYIYTHTHICMYVCMYVYMFKCLYSNNMYQKKSLIQTLGLHMSGVMMHTRNSKQGAGDCARNWWWSLAHLPRAPWGCAYAAVVCSVGIDSAIEYAETPPAQAPPSICPFVCTLLQPWTQKLCLPHRGWIVEQRMQFSLNLGHFFLHLSPAHASFSWPVPKSCNKEFSDFARDYFFSLFIIRLILFILFIRICLDIVVEVATMKTAFADLRGMNTVTASLIKAWHHKVIKSSKFLIVSTCSFVHSKRSFNLCCLSVLFLLAQKQISI